MQIAGTVIRWANRESAADHVLRNELKKAAGVNPATSWLTARLVFGYFRWLGWLDPAAAIEARLTKALDLQIRFEEDPTAFTDEELTARAVPTWTREVMELAAGWARQLQAEPTLWLRTKPGVAAEIATALPGAEPGTISDSLIYRGEQDLFVQPDFQSGRFEIQDLASQIVGHVCAPKPGEAWWDACAGEGGKTMHLSALMQNKGLIWASDRAEWRLTRLKRRAARAQVFNYRTAVWDGGEQLPTKTLFDGVLVDAPCSGMGTWQRNPHARWTVTRADVTELAAVQFTLLDRVAPSVKKGGRLIYSVCTMALEETTNVLERFAGAHPDFTLEHPTLPWLAPGNSPGVWLWPQDWKANGMFIAHWRRAN